jgi:thiol-disulfide isomerase/thioredoxin
MLMAIPAWLQAQEMNRKIIDPSLNEEILIDYCTRAGLKEGAFGEMYKMYYPIYKPDREVISKLKQRKSGLDVIIVLGTWCSDSQEQVPKFLKVWDKVYFLGSQVTIIAVNKEKKGDRVDVSRYDIQRVPTFIFTRKGKEIGRIIETPTMSLERDMLMIVGE